MRYEKAGYARRGEERSSSARLTTYSMRYIPGSWSPSYSQDWPKLLIFHGADRAPPPPLRNRPKMAGG